MASNRSEVKLRPMDPVQQRFVRREIGTFAKDDGVFHPSPIIMLQRIYIEKVRVLYFLFLFASYECIQTPDTYVCVMCPVCIVDKRQF